MTSIVYLIVAIVALGALIFVLWGAAFPGRPEHSFSHSKVAEIITRRKLVRV